MITKEDVYEAVEDILDAERVGAYNMNVSPMDLLIKAVLMCCEAMELKKCRYDIAIEREAVMNSSVDVGLKSHGDGRIDGVVRVILSDILISIKDELLFTTLGEKVISAISKFDNVVLKYAAKHNGVVMEITVSNVISSENDSRFTLFRPIDTYKDSTFRDTLERLTVSEMKSDSMRPYYDDVIDDLSHGQGALVEPEDYGMYIPESGEFYDVVYSDISLVIQNPEWFSTLVKAGLSEIYVTSEKCKAELVLRFRED